jgi:hypothetical protein
MATFSITGSWSGGTASGTWSATGLNFPQSVYYPGGSTYVTSGNGSGSWSAAQTAGTSVTYTVSGSQGSGTTTIDSGTYSGSLAVLNLGVTGTVSGTSMSVRVYWYAEMTGSSTITLTSSPLLSGLPTSWSTGPAFTYQERFFNFSGNYSTSYTFTASGEGDAYSVTLTTGAPPAVAPSWVDNSIAATARVGEAYSDSISASGTQPITYSASGLPSGLSINSSSGAITGTPAAGSQGIYTVSLTASNGTAPNATASRTITVDRAFGEAHIYNGLNWETPGEVKVYNSTTSQWDAATLWNTADGTNWTKSF